LGNKSSSKRDLNSSKPRIIQLSVNNQQVISKLGMKLNFITNSTVLFSKFTE